MYSCTLEAAPLLKEESVLKVRKGVEIEQELMTKRMDEGGSNVEGGKVKFAARVAILVESKVVAVGPVRKLIWSDMLKSWTNAIVVEDAQVVL